MKLSKPSADTDKQPEGWWPPSLLAFSLLVAGPMLLVVFWAAYSVAGGFDPFEAPKVSDVPMPNGWVSRDVGADGGSAGTVVQFVGITPAGDLTLEEAESEYRRYLVEEGWVESGVSGGDFGERWSYRSNIGLLRITVELRIDGDRDFECCFRQAVGPQEPVVVATYPDLGESIQFRRQMVVLVVAGLSVAVYFAALLTWRARRERIARH